MDDAAESLYSLSDGVPVTLEITAIDADLSVRIEDVTLDSAGDSIVLGETPDFHADALTQFVAPGGPPPDHELSLSFVLKTSAPQYAGSDELTLHFVAVAGEGGARHDDDDDHEHDDSGDDGHEHEE
jgi:hypothetical protein